MLARLKAKGLRICVWINPYIAQRSALFEEGRAKGYLVHPGRRQRLAVGQVAGRNGAGRLHQSRCRAMVLGPPGAAARPGRRRLQDRLRRAHPDRRQLVRRLATRERMHNYYTHLYNRTVFDLLERRRGDGRGGAVRPVGDRRRAAVPGALGRRLRFHLRVDGRDPARRIVAGRQRFRLLVARHRRLRGHPGRRRVQALAGVRAAVQPQPAARLRLATGCRGRSTTRRSTSPGDSPG